MSTKQINFSSNPTIHTIPLELEQKQPISFAPSDALHIIASGATSPVGLRRTVNFTTAIMAIAKQAETVAYVALKQFVSWLGFFDLIVRIKKIIVDKREHWQDTAALICLIFIRTVNALKLLEKIKATGHTISKISTKIKHIPVVSLVTSVVGLIMSGLFLWSAKFSYTKNKEKLATSEDQLRLRGKQFSKVQLNLINAERKHEISVIELKYYQALESQAANLDEIKKSSEKALGELDVNVTQGYWENRTVTQMQVNDLKEKLDFQKILSTDLENRIEQHQHEVTVYTLTNRKNIVSIADSIGILVESIFLLIALCHLGFNGLVTALPIMLAVSLASATLGFSSTWYSLYCDRMIEKYKPNIRQLPLPGSIEDSSSSIPTIARLTSNFSATRANLN